LLLNFTELVAAETVEILLGDAELLSLLQSPQSGDLRRTDFIEHDLEHV
jgi:hypothetical protein